MLGKSMALMALKVITKFKSRFKFLHRQNKDLAPVLHRLLYNALQPHFDYTLSGWYPTSLKK